MTSKSLTELLNQRRWVILGVWLFGLAVNLCLLYYSDRTEFSLSSPPAAFRDPIKKLENEYWTAYGAYVTTMLAICFARNNNYAAEDRASATPFWMALAISILWNGFLLIQTSEMALRHSLDVQTLTELVQSFVKSSAFVVSPLIVYFFSSETAK